MKGKTADETGGNKSTDISEKDASDEKLKNASRMAGRS